ncbi:MAG: right-handed parallel beta-helix repeat-containing protein [Steroidobacteraceae bacterium]
MAAGITLDLDRKIISGSGSGVGIRAGAGTTVQNGTVRRFETGALVDSGTVVLTDVALDSNFGSGLVVSPAAGETPVVNFSGPLSSASDNGSSGIVILNGAALTITGETSQAKLPVLRNGGSGMEIRGQLLATNVSIRESTGKGILIDSNASVKLTNPESSFNGGDGIHVRGTPGESNLDDATLALDEEDYGFIMVGPDSSVSNNGGHGIHLGDAVQATDVSAFLDLGIVHHNAGSGILMEQDADVQPGADCGESAGYPGCTGATIHGVIVHDNDAAGVELRTSFLMPRKIANTFYGLGFTSNKIFHNAIGPGCSAVQTQPQVLVKGLVGLGAGACGAADDVETCEGANSPVNQHCYWTGSSCIVTWDLRGAQDCDGSTANPNQIHSYNTNSDPTGSSELSVGMYASDGAIVWADNNTWRTVDTTQNVGQDSQSSIIMDTSCGGFILQCSSQ